MLGIIEGYTILDVNKKCIIDLIMVFVKIYNKILFLSFGILEEGERREKENMI